VVLEAVETHRLCQNTVCEAQAGPKNADFAKGTFAGEKSYFGQFCEFGGDIIFQGPFELCSKSQHFSWLQMEVLPFLRKKKAPSAWTTLGFTKNGKTSIWSHQKC